MALPERAYRIIGWFSTTRFDRVAHPFLYRLVGGRSFIGRPLGTETILVTAPGARSGRPRTVALFGFRRDGGWAVIASRGGSKRIPAWYRNLALAGRAVVRTGRRDLDVRVVELDGEAYEAAFEQAAAAYAGYRMYRRESPVHIPIVLLLPDSAADEVAA
jgi:deazaflavin-dependent oxidoreductase (nitroreductase family)